jgi:hypothetical protein
MPGKAVEVKMKLYNKARIMEARGGVMMKMTGRRLERVEAAQATLALAADQIEGLVVDETQQWEPGRPVSERTHRVEPLRLLMQRVEQIHAEIGRLYS